MLVSLYYQNAVGSMDYIDFEISCLHRDDTPHSLIPIEQRSRQPYGRALTWGKYRVAYMNQGSYGDEE